MQVIVNSQHRVKKVYTKRAYKHNYWQKCSAARVVEDVKKHALIHAKHPGLTETEDEALKMIKTV